MRQKNMQKIITYKWLIFIFILFFNSNSAAYDLNQKDEVILDRLEQRIMTVINTKKSVTPVWIVELIENSLDTWKYNQRIESILRELKDRIDTVYLVSKFAEVDWPTPILYTSDFATQFGWQDWVTLNFDRFGEIDAVEHIAPAGTVFQIHEYRWDVVRITTDEYPFSHNRQLFIHKDFVSKKSRIKPVPQEKIQPSKEEILRKLKSIEGADYVWGWNIPEGIPQLLQSFPPSAEISEKIKNQWMLKWVDCSGMIYWASNWVTPRNTSAIVNFWRAVEIEWKKLEEITKELKPLDIIVWRGHMLVIYDGNYTIESAVSYLDWSKWWVRLRKIEDSLWEILRSKTPVNNYDNSIYGNTQRFVIRRWIED